MKAKKQTLETLKRWGRKSRKLAVAFCKDPRIVAVWYGDIREAVVHFVKWVKTGCKRFGANVRVSSYLLKRVLTGYPLTNREHGLLVRTMSDCTKIIPFSFFIIIPFAELALPIFLRLFPNMLPSTFFEQKYDNATLARKFKAKEDMAEFWQEVMGQRTQEIFEENVDGTCDKAQLLEEFQEKLTEGQEFPTLKEIIKISKLFAHEFRLVNMSPDQISALAKLLGLSQRSWWPGHVRVQLRHHITQIRREDRDYMWEGIRNLTRVELIEACKKRAIRFHDVSEAEMRADFARWLELSAGHKEIPPVLLLWIQSFYLSASDPGSDAEIEKLPLKNVYQASQAAEDDLPDKAFSDMAKRRKEKFNSAEQSLKDRRHEIDSVLEASQASEEGKPALQEEDDSTSPAGAAMELEQEEKERVLGQVRQMNQTLRIYKQVAGQQKELIDKQLEFLVAMRSNQPTHHKDPESILLDQQVRLFDIVKAFERGLEEIDEMMTAEKAAAAASSTSSVDDFPSSLGEPGRALMARLATVPTRNILLERRAARLSGISPREVSPRAP